MVTRVTKRRDVLRLATKADRVPPMAVRRTRPPQKNPGGLPPSVVQQVPAMKGADRSAKLSVESGQPGSPLMRTANYSWTRRHSVWRAPSQQERDPRL